MLKLNFDLCNRIPQSCQIFEIKKLYPQQMILQLGGECSSNRNVYKIHDYYEMHKANNTKGSYVKGISAVLLFIWMSAVSPCLATQDTVSKTAPSLCHFVTNTELGFWPQIKQDYKTHYGRYGLPRLFTGLSIAAVLANTGIDESLQNRWQSDIRNRTTDRISDINDHYVNDLSQYAVAIPIYLLSTLSGSYSSDPTIQSIAKWGNHSFRALLVGVPQQALLTEILGSTRPENGPSDWKFLKDNRAVSGHAFFGSLPILTTAKLSDSLYVKIPLYGLSLLPPLARINNNKHYSSQAFLGWWIAWQSVNSISESNKVRKSDKIKDMQLIVLPKQIYFHYTMQL